MRNQIRRKDADAADNNNTLTKNDNRVQGKARQGKARPKAMTQQSNYSNKTMLRTTIATAIKHKFVLPKAIFDEFH